MTANANFRRTVAAVALLAAATVSYLSWRTHRALEELAALNRQIARVAARRESLRSQLLAARSSADDAKRKDEAKRKAELGAKPKKPGFLEGLRSNPLVQARYLEYHRTEAQLKYGPLFAKLHLTPQQIEQFEDNELAKESAWTDLRTALAAKAAKDGLTQHDVDAAMSTLGGQIHVNYTTEQTALLGADGFQQAQQYEREFFPRAMVSNWAGLAVVSGVEMDASQVEKMNSIVVNAFTQRNSNGVDWSAVQQQAEAVLSPDQAKLIRETEVIGPFGIGTRFQFQLNDLITRGDTLDHSEAVSKSVAR